MYLDSHNAGECCGCSACNAVCPQKAISMKLDSKGFLAPVINEERCVHCNLCRNVCSFHLNNTCDHSVLSGYAMSHSDAAVLKKSRSGGAFYALASVIINDFNGSVWGAAFDESLKVIHTKITSVNELSRLQGSKYVQSEMGEAFEDVYKELQTGKYVLFSGTACQVAGLESYLKKKRSNTEHLLTCDIICQGVPSPAVYKDYLDYLENKYKKKLSYFNFRDPSRIGWEGHEESFSFAGSSKRYYSRSFSNLYYRYYMRESCFECKYTNLHRPGDFSLGDFWGIKEKYPDYYEKNGNSLVLINSEKGESFFERIKPFMKYVAVDIEDALQPRLRSPASKPDSYDRFWDDFASGITGYCIEKYGRESLKSKIVYFIKPVLRKIGKNI